MSGGFRPECQIYFIHDPAWPDRAPPPSRRDIERILDDFPENNLGRLGKTGVQVASIFTAFGSQVQLFQSGPRILAGDDVDVSAAVAAAFREQGISGEWQLARA